MSKGNAHLLIRFGLGLQQMVSVCSIVYCTHLPGELSSYYCFIAGGNHTVETKVHQTRNTIQPTCMLQKLVLYWTGMCT